MNPPNAPLLITRITSPGLAPLDTARQDLVDGAQRLGGRPERADLLDERRDVELLRQRHLVVALGHLEAGARGAPSKAWA